MKINRPDKITRYQKISELTLGDPVDVLQTSYFNSKTLEQLHPATVCYVDDHQVGVAFSDGTTEMFPKSAPKRLYPTNKYELEVSSEPFR